MTREQTKARERLARLFDSDKQIVQAIQRAMQDALLDHKRVGNPIAGWQNGSVIWIQPEDIRLDGETP